MLLHRLFSVFLCAHYDQVQREAILELSYPGDQTKETVLCKSFHMDNGICSCVLGSNRILSPKFSLDPKTCDDSVHVNADGWLEKGYAFHRNPSAIPDLGWAARTPPSLSGPESIFFVVQLQLHFPLPLYHLIVLQVVLGSNASVFSYDRNRLITNIPKTVAVQINIESRREMEVRFWNDGSQTGPAKTLYHENMDVWLFDLGVLIDFKKKQIVFVNVAESVVMRCLHGIDTQQPLVSLLTIGDSRARIRSGGELQISRQIKALLSGDIN